MRNQPVQPPVPTGVSTLCNPDQLDLLERRPDLLDNAVEELLRRLPNLRLASEAVERGPSMVVRPLTRLPLAFDPPQPQEDPELELVA